MLQGAPRHAAAQGRRRQGRGVHRHRAARHRGICQGSPDRRSNNYPSISIALSKIYRTEGVPGLYSGLVPALIGMLPYSTRYYFMYNTIKTPYCRLHKKKSLSRPELLIIGALTGLTASTISFPLEVARKRLMVGTLQGKCPPHIMPTLLEVIREEGLLGIYRGWGASCLKVTRMFYKGWKDILLADPGQA